MKGGYHPGSRLEQNVAGDWPVHEQTLAADFARADAVCDREARWAYALLRKAFARNPTALAVIAEHERAFWEADTVEDGTVTRHVVEGVALLAEISDLMAASEMPTMLRPRAKAA